VGQTADAHHADHSGGAFHRVRFAKDRIDRRLVVGGGLQRKQPGRDSLEVTLGLLNEERAELVL